MMARQRSRVFTVATFGSMGAVFIGMINLVTIRNIWIMVAVAGALAALTVLAVKERNRIKKQRRSENPSK
ncbi:MAG: hypothetical protein ACREBU_08910 [Nitrososphaera sp.]